MYKTFILTACLLAASFSLSQSYANTNGYKPYFCENGKLYTGTPSSKHSSVLNAQTWINNTQFPVRIYVDFYAHTYGHMNVHTNKTIVVNPGGNRSMNTCSVAEKAPSLQDKHVFSSPKWTITAEFTLNKYFNVCTSPQNSFEPVPILLKPGTMHLQYGILYGPMHSDTYPGKRFLCTGYQN